MTQPTYGKASAIKLATCHPDIVRVFKQVLALGFDHTVIEGHRGEAAQNAAFDGGFSKLRWPDGNHNKFPSAGIDAAPYTKGRMVDGRQKGDLLEMAYFAGFVLATAAAMGVKMRWGGDFNRNRDLDDDGFDDSFHFELD